MLKQPVIKITMFVVRKLPIRSVSQLTINSVCTICKRNDLKVISRLQAHTTAKPFVGTRCRNLLSPQRGSTGQILNMATSIEDKTLTYDEVFGSKKRDKITLIDVREASELKETGTLPDSIHIPLGQVVKALKASDDEFEKMYSAPKPKLDDELVFSCRGGKRSAQALQTALSQGYSNAKHYGGGWMDYEEKSKKKTEL